MGHNQHEREEHPLDAFLRAVRQGAPGSRRAAPPQAHHSGLVQSGAADCARIRQS